MQWHVVALLVPRSHHPRRLRRLRKVVVGRQPVAVRQPGRGVGDYERLQSRRDRSGSGSRRRRLLQPEREHGGLLLLQRGLVRGHQRLHLLHLHLLHLRTVCHSISTSVELVLLNEGITAGDEGVGWSWSGTGTSPSSASGTLGPVLSGEQFGAASLERSAFIFVFYSRPRLDLKLLLLLLTPQRASFHIALAGVPCIISVVVLCACGARRRAPGAVHTLLLVSARCLSADAVNNTLLLVVGVFVV